MKSDPGAPLYPTKVIAKLFNLTERRIQQLTKEGVIQQAAQGRYELAPTIQGYIKYLQERAFGRGNTDSDLQKEKILLTRANRQKAELEVQVMRGELHRSEDVRRVMNDMLGAFRARCLAIPTRAAPKLIDQKDIAVIQDILKAEVYEALAELSEYDPEVFYQHSKDTLVLGGGEETTTEEVTQGGGPDERE